MAVCIVKPVYNDHPGDPKMVVVVQRYFCAKKIENEIPKTVVVVGWWWLFGEGH
jgi:hypothetical protein